MKISNDLESFYRSNITQKLEKKTKSLQFLPKCLNDLNSNRNFNFCGKKLKSSYIVDIVHNLMLKYYFKKENRYTLNATILKQKYGHEYKSYIDYLISKDIIRLKCNYKAGVTSRIYELNPKIFKQSISRVKNDDKVLIKKYKKKIYNTIDFVNSNESSIFIDIREKLISDLFLVDIDLNRSILYLNCLKNQDIDIYNRNVYSAESISDKHIFYHFDNYGRLHTNFTILKSFIRKNCLTISGEETCEIDIKNSQPLFLCKLIQDSQTSWVNREEFDFFKKLVISGSFYQYLMQVTGEKDRSKVKELTYKVLFGQNRSNSKADQEFMTIFPTIYNFIKLYKKEWGNHKVLAHELQRAESNLIFNKIIKKVMILYPDINIVTVHDSLIFPKKWRTEVQSIFDYELNNELSF